MKTFSTELLDITNLKGVWYNQYLKQVKFNMEHPNRLLVHRKYLPKYASNIHISEKREEEIKKESAATRAIEQRNSLVKLLDSQGHPIKEIAGIFDVSTTAIYNILK